MTKSVPRGVAFKPATPPRSKSPKSTKSCFKFYSLNLPHITSLSQLIYLETTSVCAYTIAKPIKSAEIYQFWWKRPVFTIFFYHPQLIMQHNHKTKIFFFAWSVNFDTHSIRFYIIQKCHFMQIRHSRSKFKVKTHWSEPNF